MINMLAVYLLIFLLVVFLIITANIFFFTICALSEDADTSKDVIVIFGCRVYEDGTPSNCLKLRLDKALELYKEDRSRIIVTGGTGVDKVNEALAMKIYLSLKGVNEIDIIAETKGINTYCSAKNTKMIMDLYNFSSAIIVTSSFHIARAKYIMKRIGVKDIGTARADSFSFKNIKYFLREIPAFYYYLFRKIKSF